MVKTSRDWLSAAKLVVFDKKVQRLDGSGGVPSAHLLRYSPIHTRNHEGLDGISQIQGKESTEIPAEIYDRILLEIKKQRITNMAEITTAKVKEILKRLSLNKYYEHTPHILNRLNGSQGVSFTPEIEEKLRQMFKMIQIPFFKHAPKNRKNFLSYSYTIHKCLQLLELDEYLKYFPLLKSREKTFQMDEVWQKICAELNWQFIPSL
jgi:Zn/Cd-binding protein ZinT